MIRSMRLLVILFCLYGLTACTTKFQSQLKAKEACDKWAKKGIQFNIEPEGYLESIDFKGITTNRFCEKKELQYIGYSFNTPADIGEISYKQLQKMMTNAEVTMKFKW